MFWEADIPRISARDEAGKATEVIAVTDRWEVHGTAIGSVTDTGAMRIFDGEELVGEVGIAAGLGYQANVGDGADQPAVPVADELRPGDVLDVRVGDVGEGEVLRAVGEGELELAQAHKYCAAGDHCTGAEPVHEHPHRNLEPCINKELKDGEEGDR